MISEWMSCGGIFLFIGSSEAAIAAVDFRFSDGDSYGRERSR